MILRLLGAVFVIVGFLCVCYMLSVSNKRTTTMLKHLYVALEYMEYELQYRQSPLPELLRRSAINEGQIKAFFHSLADEIESQIAPDVEYCVVATLGKFKNFPEIIDVIIRRFSKCIGRFDLENQIKGLTSMRKDCAIALEKYTMNQGRRLYSYQALALCIGAGLVVVLL